MENLQPDPPLGLPRWLPIILGISILVTTLWLWSGLVQDSRTRFLRMIEMQKQSATFEISEQLKSRMKALTRMAERWEENGKPSPKEWASEAELYLDLYPGYQMIEWIDPSLYARWIAPEKGNESQKDVDLSDDPLRQHAIEEARYRKEVWLSHCFELPQGGKGFLGCISIFYGKEPGGFLIGYFDIQKLFKTILSKNVSSEYSVTIFDGLDKIYSDEPEGLKHQKEGLQEATIAFNNIKWNVQIWPRPELLAKQKSYFPDAILVGGILASVLITFATFFAQQAKRHARQVGFINRQLNYEIIERKRTEGELQKAGEELEQRVQDRTAALSTANQSLQQEIIERERAQEAIRNSEFKFRSVAESANDAIISTDHSGKIIFWNQGARNMFDCTEAEVQGKTFFSVISEKFHQQVIDHFRAIGQGETQNKTIELIGKKKDETEFPIEFSLASWKSGSEIFYTAVCHNIAEHKRVEEILAQARDAALEAARLKSEFLANVSHEIRTPMNGIIGMTGLLLQSHLTNKQREFADAVRSCANELLTLINDILDFSRIEAGKLRFETLNFDLLNTVESTVEFLAERAQAKGIELAVLVAKDVPTMLTGDPGRLRQVLTNLVGNAIKFTERGEVIIRVTCESENETHAVVRFSVKDTGIGISEEHKQRLFQPFMQADSSMARKHGGTGLGLAISKQIVAGLGGEINMEGAPEKGSIFWFTVRFSKQPSSVPSTLSSDHSLKGTRALIIDDNISSQEILSIQMEDWGIECDKATNGAEALLLLKKASDQKPYHLAMIDMSLPGTDAFVLAKAIKSDVMISSTRLMMMTLLGQEDVDKMSAVGIETCLTKPIKKSQLFDCLHQMIKSDPHSILSFDESADQKKRTDSRIYRHATTIIQKRARILIAEDNIVNQKVALGQLQELGYSAEAVADGKEVLDALARIPYDLIFMDCQMPEMDGYETTVEIRRREENSKHTIIIALTANAMEADREKCLAAGMDDYISKPLAPEDLKKVLDRWLDSANKNPSVSKINSHPKKISTLIDLKRLKMVAGKDPKNAKKLVELYINQTAEDLVKLTQAVETGSVEIVGKIAHRCLGSSQTCGMAILAPLFRELVHLSQNSHSEQLIPLTEQIKKEFERIRAVAETEEDLIGESLRQIPS